MTGVLWSMRTLVVMLLVASSACASATLKRTEQRALVRADALFREGCYTCLVEARDLYASTLARRRPPVLVQRLFEVELLIILREKELALDSTAAFDRALALATELPPELMADRYLRLAEAVPPDDTGTPRQGRTRWMMNRLAPTEVELAPLHTGSLSGLVRQYLAVSLDCAYRANSRSPGPPAPAVPGRGRDPVPPLLDYRAAICFPPDADMLERLSATTRFVETNYFLGKIALRTAGDDGGSKADALMEKAYAAFPLSSGITYLRGSVKQIAGDCRAAQRFYDETLAMQPLHEDALLGRTVCLSYLGQSEAAIAAATRMIDLRTDNQGDAFYWRAWNRHQRGEVVFARADIERAKALRFNSSVLTLAGIIEHDQDDLGPAETDLAAAKTVDPSNCVANWYLALVGLKREAWLTAATQFTSAMECYRASALDTEHRMQAMAAREDLDPAWRSAQLAGFEAAIKEDRSQESASAYNAAVNFLRGGDRTRALALADLAARDPVRLSKVEELRKLIPAGESR
jgi:tetratricopeptide (TPR) repeat protein